jgi:hypothetical protein
METMVLSMRILVVMMALIAMLAISGPRAYAFGKHKSHQPRVQKQKKNASPYAYLGPTKHQKVTTYRSPVSGNVLYGTKKK